MALYEDLGQFFTPDGAFVEDRFCYQFEILFREQLETQGPRETEAWLFGYLSEIVDYLNDRDRRAQTIRVLEVATEVLRTYVGPAESAVGPVAPCVLSR